MPTNTRIRCRGCYSTIEISSIACESNRAVSRSHRTTLGPMDDQRSYVPNLTRPNSKDRAIVEVEVHRVLRSFLRSSQISSWPHHLTMGRLVARALRLGRGALIQTGSFGEFDGRYRLSYLMPLLMWPEAAILVAPTSIHSGLLDREIPQLQAWGETRKLLSTGE